MKRVALTDSRTKAIHVLENPPWRLDRITPQKDGTFDVRMIHDSGKKMTVNVSSDKGSLIKRFEGW